MNADSRRLTLWVSAALKEREVDLPAFPAIAVRLVALLEDSDVEMSELGELISRDPATMAQVLRAANSVLFGGIMPIGNVDQAIIRLGFKDTASIVLASACRSLFDPRERSEFVIFQDMSNALWQNSLVCAFGARLLSRELKVGDPQRAFVGAIFRDLGSLLILKIMSKASVNGRLLNTPGEEELASVLSDLHHHVGAGYLRRANMPNYVVRIAAEHHAAFVPFQADTVDLHLVRLSDSLSERVGTPPFSPSQPGPLSAIGKQSVEFLGIGGERLEYFELQFEALSDQVRELI
jgi:HD-like signal output (HDOD) protein